jgi:diacylglycerol kinase (ATP)
MRFHYNDPSNEGSIFRPLGRDWCSIGFQHTTIIYNPVAGRLRGKARQRLDRAAAILADAGYSASLIPTPGPNTAGDIARQAVRDRTQLILVAGGDGTLNETLEGLVGSPVPLGILPAGTANVLGTEIGLPKDLEQATRMIPQCVPQRIAVGRLDAESGRRHFLSMAGVGFDAQIIYGLNARWKRRLGKAAYWLAGFGQAVRRFPEFEIDIDGGERLVCSFALVSRVRNYGGDFQIARSVRLLEDRFEVVLFRGGNSLPYLKYLCGMVAGRLAGMRGVSFLTAQSVRVWDPAGRPVHIQVDGEYAGRLPASIRLEPNAVTLLVPPACLREAETKSAGSRVTSRPAE